MAREAQCDFQSYQTSPSKAIKAKAQYQIPLNLDPPRHLPRFHISLVATSCKCPLWTLFWKYREMRILPTLKWALQQVGNVADILWYFYDIFWYFDEILWYFMIFYDILWYFMIFHDILMRLLTLKRALHQVAIQPAPRPRDAGTKIVKLEYLRLETSGGIKYFSLL